MSSCVFLQKKSNGNVRFDERVKEVDTRVIGQFYYVLYAILRIVAVSINLDILDASCQFFELDRAEIC